ncbi:MAG TPA: methyltransferase [Myxococcota bacterium]|jgi:protein-S-isoprenylcysteine O-methyltransferase Ste14
MTRRISIFVFGVLSYALFFAVFLYAAGFMANWLVPRSLDSGPAPSAAVALAANFGLLCLFGLQHSVMARPGFKRWWTRIVPTEAERSLYVLASSLAMIALYAYWQPLPGVVFELEHPVARALAWGLCAAGYGIVLYSTFLIDHFDLFGLRQSWLALRGQAYTSRPFRTPSLYRYVRHPLYVGWLLFFWGTPVMTVGHLVIAVGITAYIFVAIVFEERDLLNHFGADYRAWRASTPLLIPRLRSRKHVQRESEIREAA